MKFSCENCQAKYHIADEKIAGRSVRMTCRKCGHTIEIGSSPVEVSATLAFSASLLRAGAGAAGAVLDRPAGGGPGRGGRGAKGGAVMGTVVQGGLTPAGAAGGGPAPTDTVVFDGLAPGLRQAMTAKAKRVTGQAPSGAGEWFVGSNGSHAGPFDVEGLRAQALAGAVQEGSLVWREGMREWLPLAAVPELREVASVVRPERSPLSSRAGALVGRLGLGARPTRSPASAGPASGGEVGGGAAPADRPVHETMVLSPGALPNALPGLLGRPTGGKFAVTRNPPVPSTPAPASPARPTGPAAAAPAPALVLPSLGPGAPWGSGASGGPGTGAPAGPTSPSAAPFPQPYGAPAMAGPPGYGAPAPFAAGAAGASPGVVPAGLPARSKNGLLVLAMFTAALSLGTGVVLGAKLRSGEKTAVEVAKGDAAVDAPAADSPGANDPKGMVGGSNKAAGATVAAKAETGGASGAGKAAPVESAAGSAKAVPAEGAAGSAKAAPAESAAGSSKVASVTNAAGSSGAGAGDGAAGSGAVASALRGKKRNERTASKPTPPVDNGKPVEATIVSDKKPAAPPPPAPAAPAAPAPAPPQGEQLTTEQVQGMVDLGRAALRRACWEPALAASGGGAASARLTLSLTIGPDGKVREAIAAGGSAFPSLGSCVAGRVRSWIFPTAAGVTQTSVPLKFTSQ